MKKFGVFSSKKIIKSKAISGSKYVYKSDAISACKYIRDCHGLHHSYFCVGIDTGCYLFNKKVPYSRLVDVKLTLNRHLKNWRFNYYDWEAMPEEAVEYVQSLPEYYTFIFGQTSMVPAKVSKSDPDTNRNVTDSSCVTASDDVHGSFGVDFSNGIFKSQGIQLSRGISECFAIKNCYGLSNSLFCDSLPPTYYLFNKKVPFKRTCEISLALNVLRESEKKTLRYIKSLPEYDEKIFKEIIE